MSGMALQLKEAAQGISIDSSIKSESLATYRMFDADKDLHLSAECTTLCVCVCVCVCVNVYMCYCEWVYGCVWECIHDQ